MPDTKITALAAITTVDPAADVLPIVDISDTSMAASGTTKKITSNQILGAGGTATLASATITGDLTVRTDKLAVRSTGVGIGTTTPNASYILDLTTAYDARARQWIADSSFIGSGNLANGFTIRTLSGTTDGIRFLNYAQTTEFMRIDSSGNVGIGVTPSAWISAVKGLQVGAYGAIGGSSSNFNMYGNLYSSATGTAYLGNGFGTLLQMTGGQYVFYQAGNNTSGAGALATLTQAMTLDASGRLLVGRTSPISAETFSSNGFALIGGATHQALIGEASGNVFAGSFTNTPFRVRTNNVEVAQFDASGNFLSYLTSTAPTLSTNGAMVFNLTSNTNLRISVRGTDGVTRTANITLA